MLARCRWRTKTAIAVGLVVGALLNPFMRPALGGEGDKVAARAHYETATWMYEVREYAEALKEYKAAYIAKADPAFLFNIGQCYRKMDKNAEALDFFQQYLKKAPPDDPNRAQVEARIRNIQAGLNSDYDPFAKPEAVKTALPPVVEVRPVSAPGPISLPEPAQQPSARSSLPVQQQTAPTSVPTPSAGQPAGVDLAVSAPAKEDQVSKPIYGTWWFWTGVGAVVVAGTVTAIALSSRGGGTNVPGTTLGSRPVFP
jgi:hypothetical protein